MKRNKKTIFTKSLYTAFAVLVLLVAAGIASYAAAPAGSATHATLYTDEIWGKTGNTVLVKDNLNLEGLVAAGPVILSVHGNNDPLGHTKGISSVFDENGVAIEGQIQGTGGVGVKGIADNLGSSAVEGTNTVNSNSGKLGTSAAGVEGTSSSGYGVKGTTTTGTAGVEGTNGANYGRLGTGTAGIYGYSNTGNAISSYSSNGNGLSVGTGSLTGYAGYFSGGKGLYANKIEFGTSAFDVSDGSGLLILGALSTQTCTSLCTNHGLGCMDAYNVAGTQVACSSTTLGRYCWCGRA